MDKAVPTSITIEEAVARMVNMDYDYIPAGLTLFEMIAAFQEEAEVEFENACMDRLPKDEIKFLEMRLDVCMARYSLTKRLLESLQYEVGNPEGSMILLANDSPSQLRLNFESVSDWAVDRYGINISEWSSVHQNHIGIPEYYHSTNATDKNLKNVCWEDVTIKIWKDDQLGVFFKKKKKHRRSNFRDVGLWDKRGNKPNILGGILIDISEGGVFPRERLAPKHSTAMCKLQRALIEWIGLSGQPFHDYNHEDGWKPRFTLKDDRNNSSDRVMKRSTYYDDTQKYDDND